MIKAVILSERTTSKNKKIVVYLIEYAQSYEKYHSLYGIYGMIFSIN